jgi:hypothetical protein
MSDDTNSLILARVVAQGRHLSLLVEASILDNQKACRVRVTLESRTYRGFGFSLDTDTVLLVINAPALTGFEVGSSLALSKISVVWDNMGFEHIRDRLRSLLNMESLGSLSDRAARHALLYIIEARDPEVRRQRLEVLNTALTTEAFLERSEQQYDSNP